VPVCETLEHRTLLSGSSLSDRRAALAFKASHLGQHLDPSSRLQPAIGTISGTITNTNTGRPLKGVRVQLINSNGLVAGRTPTGPRGRYQFKINGNGAYVVREVTPPRWVQTSPTFVYTAPTGMYAPGASSASWSYNTGNSDPSMPPVGIYAWNTIAPAGDLPFESPINITVPPINLSPYLSVSFRPTVANVIIKNGHEVQVKLSPSPSNSIKLGGTLFQLDQLHFHDPSENQVDGKGYSMEEHLVTVSTTGAVTVLAVFLKLGFYNAALQPILDAATASLTTPASPTTISTSVNIAGLLPSSMQGWFYAGSFTSPPLKQSVNWIVFSTPITLNYSQLQQYEAVAKTGGFLPNARPIQPLDGRQVHQFNYDVNFQNQSVGSLNFTLRRRF